MYIKDLNKCVVNDKFLLAIAILVISHISEKKSELFLANYTRYLNGQLKSPHSDSPENFTYAIEQILQNNKLRYKN